MARSRSASPCLSDRFTRSIRSRSASVAAAVMLSPVSAASSRASRCASSLLMFRLIILPHSGRNLPSLGCLASRGGKERIEGAAARRNRDDGLCRGLSTIAGASPAILGRGGRGDRLGAALGPGARRQPAAVLPLVLRGAAQHLLER